MSRSRLLNFSTMTIVVTGASGHVGANLVRLMLERGHTPRVLVHKDQRALHGLDVEVVHGDVRDLASLEKAFAGGKMVFHLAALISLFIDEWPLLEAINIRGTENVLRACQSCGVKRLVHFSSIEALSPVPLDEPLDESRALNTRRRATPYGRSKAAAERLVRRAMDEGANAVILNPTAMIGPNDFGPSAMGQVLLDLAGRKLPALINGGFDWVDIRDVIRAAMTAAEKAPPGSRYLLSGHWRSLSALAEIVHSITGVAPPGFVCPMWLARMGAPFAELGARLTGTRPRYSRASLRAIRGNRNISHAKATAELAYQPRPLEQTLADAFTWMQANGYLQTPEVTK